ncbi:MAG: CBS domain-containing protein [Brevundimonas sp.]|uniref:CBS domain-containing protein n=1 Tax=Brevundimonas sp. TaxID=1871086 RepID=UPI0027346715|nr:CBS domain-containing protein [Brevundimonas sp.]MDP3405427.1 CBS domain-containing protein [Brevundimonas sp.]
MLVSEILKEKGGAVFSVAPDITLAAVCGRLESCRVGALMVCDKEQVVGVISERDIVRSIATDGAASLSRPVSDYMTRDVIFADPGESVATVMGRMTDRRIRHLPVMKDGRLAGVISIGDVVKSRVAEATRDAESLRTYIAG